MKHYTAICEGAGKKVALSDMILTKNMPTCAGSNMLAGYVSLFDATVAEKLAEIRGLSVEEIHAITTENGKTLYRI